MTVRDRGRHRSLLSLSKSVNALDEEKLFASSSIPLGSSIHLSWLDVELSFRLPKPGIFDRLLNPEKMKTWKEDEGKMVLSGVVGEVRPGEMVGIMGESGAGKTKLMEILSGKLSAGEAHGCILVNGSHRSPDGWSRLVSYIEIWDKHDSELSVEELVKLACHLRCDKVSYDGEAKDHLANKLISAVGLAQRKKVRAKHLSSGELRRLTIAVEMSAQRRLICIDEPTAGLDSATALDIINMIKSLAVRYNLSVLCVIHQPRASILALFDRLVLLSRGRMIYYGSLGETLTHLETVSNLEVPSRENPADYIMDMISTDRLNSGLWRQSEQRYSDFSQAWATIEAVELQHRPSVLSRVSSLGKSSNRSARSTVTLFLGSGHDSIMSPNPQILPNAEYSKWPIPPYEEFSLLFVRFIKGEYRDVRSWLCFFIGYTLLGLFHGFLFFQLTLENFGGFQSRLGLLINISGVQMTIMAGEVAGQFFSVLDTIKHERAGHSYRCWTVFLAKFTSMLPLRLFTFSVFGTVIYYIAGLRTDSFTYFLIFMGLNWLSLIVLMALGVIFATFNLPLLGVYLGMGFFALSGLPVRIPDITPILSWLRFLSPAYFSLQGLIQNESAGLVFDDGVTGDEYLTLFAMNEISVMWCAGALMLTATGYLVIAYIGLDRVTKPRFKII